MTPFGKAWLAICVVSLIAALPPRDSAALPPRGSVASPPKDPVASPIRDTAEGQSDRYRTRMRLQMGSFTEITVPAADYTHRAVSRAFDAVEALDRLLSTYRPESEVSRLAAAGRLAVSPEVLEITALAIRMARATGGAFNPALGPVIQLWRDAEARQVPPSPAELARARRSTDYERVLLQTEPDIIAFAEPGMALNFGAIGKGYALDKAAEVLLAEGIDSAMLASGGSSHRLLGHPLERPCWEMAIRHPEAPDRLVAFLLVGAGGMATSAQSGKQRVIQGRTYGHIIDARTGRPADPETPIWSATVWAPDAATADALATALIVMEAARGLELIETRAESEALIVRRAPDGSPFLQSTSGIVRRGELDDLPLYVLVQETRCLGGSGAGDSSRLVGSPIARLGQNLRSGRPASDPPS